MNREDIQNKVYSSQVFKSYSAADDILKEEYYFSRDLKCCNNGAMIDPESLFCYSVKALKQKLIGDKLNDLHYDLHIVIVGTTLQPLMLSVSAISSTDILLLYSSDGTERKKDTLIDFIKAYKSIDAQSIPVNSSKPCDIFAVIKNNIDTQFYKGKKICIDITGGKKTMVGGAFLASSILEIDMCYIDFEKYQNGMPVLCTEFLNMLDNPYDIFSIREEQLIFELWSRKNYSEVGQQLKALLSNNKFSKTIADDYGLQEERNTFENLQKAALCYDAWRKFDYYTAINHYFNNYNVFHNAALDDLAKCSKGYGKEPICEYSDAKSALKLAIDRYVRGGDAVSSQEWNRAALSYTQAVEALIRYAIRHALNTLSLKDITFHDALINKPHNYSASALLLILFKNTNTKKQKKPVFDTAEGDYYFSDSILCGDIIEKVLKKRNELSHFECIISDPCDDENKNPVPDYFSVLTDMKETVKRFFELFAAKYDINPSDIEHFIELVTYCTLDEHLVLRHPASPL